MSARRPVAGEFLGTALLLATVVGSGIMAERLAGGNVAVALLANTGATGAILLVLITALGPLSGAHFNPAVTLAQAWRQAFAWSMVPAYLAAQIAGAVGGVLLAHAMFEEPLFQLSQKVRSGPAQALSEAVATFGLLLVIRLVSRRDPQRVAASVAAYICAAYWFTASTSFANPAVTIARALSDTFAGIRPADAPAFILAQLAGAALALAVESVLEPFDEKSGVRSQK